jgi:exosortase D (VPLPA-CTERM-specific)
MSIANADGAHADLKTRSRAGTVLVLAAVVALGVVYVRPLTYLSSYWDQPEYGHGYLIPFIAFLLGWHDLTRRRPFPNPSWSGSGWLIVGLGFMVIGQLSTFNAVSVYGFIIALIGVSLSFAGWPTTRTLLPAFGMLFFAVPLPNVIYLSMSTRMQLVSSALGSNFLDLLGLPVYQDGNVIDLGVMKLEVAQACSGLRYLFPLASFGYLASYLLEDRLWKRAVLLISVLPIAIFINASRIALIGVSVNVWGKAMATGLIHYSEGFAAFLVCGVLMLAEAWLLLRIGRHRGRFRLEYFRAASGPVLRKPLPASLPGILTLVLIVGVGAGADAAIGTLRAPVEHSAVPALSETIPLRLGDWRGAPLLLSPEVLDALKLTDYFLAEYRSDTSASPVALYLAYYASQTVGAATHSPGNCLPAGGWEIVHSSVISIPARAGHPERSVNRLQIRHGAEEQLVYYWFNERGRTLTTPWGVKWYLLKDQLLTGRSDGYLVRVTTPYVASQGPESDDRMRAFLGQFDDSFTL